MPITKREKDGVTILAPTGNLVIENSHELRYAVREALEGGAKKIVLNLSGVTRVDSSGLGEMVSGFSTSQQRDAKLKLAAPPPRINDLLYITKLITVFEVFDTEDEAVKSFA